MFEDNDTFRRSGGEDAQRRGVEGEEFGNLVPIMMDDFHPVNLKFYATLHELVRAGYDLEAMVDEMQEFAKGMESRVDDVEDEAVVKAEIEEMWRQYNMESVRPDVR